MMKRCKGYFRVVLLLAGCFLAMIVAGCIATSSPPAMPANSQTATPALPILVKERATPQPTTRPTEGASADGVEPEPTESSAPAPSSPSPSSPPSPSSLGDARTLLVALEETLHNIYTRVGPSVVHIRVVQKHTGITSELPDSPDMPFVVPEDPQEFFIPGLGSGFVWDREGHIVTNNHVVEGADRITVTFHDGTAMDAELVGADPDSDLAVVRVDMPPDQLQPVEVFDSNQVRVGQIAIAIGNPFGLEGTMTVGFVSALGRSLPVGTMGTGPSYSIPDIIQTDASINPGNSGGALLDDQGRLIGVPSAIRSPVQASVGIGFAIPSAIVQRVVPVLIETGTYEHPWLGVMGTTLTTDLAREMELDPNQHGALVLEVVTDGPSDAAGVRGSDRQVLIEGIERRVGGDVIIAFDGRPVEQFDDLVTYLNRYTQVGQTVKLTVLRQGKETTLDVTLESRPTASAPTEEVVEEETSNTWLGIRGLTLVPALAEAMELPEDQEGVLVQQVEQDSPADQAHLRGSFKNVLIEGEYVLIGGDVIIAANERPIRMLEDLQQLVRRSKPGEELTLTVLRDGKEEEVTVTLEEYPD
ncbi:MAG: PDZ domain-containing protein [Chloroflexaceae bacterium]|nr:PDZ domain-containing protein [Chloroflexaceae bacterium]